MMDPQILSVVVAIVVAAFSALAQVGVVAFFIGGINAKLKTASDSISRLVDKIATFEGVHERLVALERRDKIIEEMRTSLTRVEVTLGQHQQNISAALERLTGFAENRAAPRHRGAA